LLLVMDSETAAINEVRAGRIGHDRLEHVRLDEEAEKRLPPPAVDEATSGTTEPPKRTASPTASHPNTPSTSE